MAAVSDCRHLGGDDRRHAPANSHFAQWPMVFGGRAIKLREHLQADVSLGRKAGRGSVYCHRAGPTSRPEGSFPIHGGLPYERPEIRRDSQVCQR